MHGKRDLSGRWLISGLCSLAHLCLTQHWRITENKDKFQSLLCFFHSPSPPPLPPRPMDRSCLGQLKMFFLQLIPVNSWPLGADLTKKQEVALALPQPCSPGRFICTERMTKESVWLVSSCCRSGSKQTQDELFFVCLSWKPVVWFCWVLFSWWDCDVAIAYPTEMGQEKLLLIQIA